MAKLEILEKSYEYLDAKENPTFRINIDVLNQAFGIGRGMFAKACFPDKKNTYILDSNNDKYIIWMPKLYSNKSGWKNSISSDESVIYEIAEDSRMSDWTENGEHLLFAKRIVFIKKSAKSPYRFVGIYENDQFTQFKHSYKRIATKINVIDNPVTQIELVK